MSSSSATPKEGKEKRGVDKVLYKMKTVFNRRSFGSRKGQPSPTPVATPEPPVSQPVAPPPPKLLPDYEGATVIPRIQIHEERAKKLAARFGLEIKPSEWHNTEGEVYRVDKPVRMRIRRQCHRCQARFGAGNVCPSCQHNLCKQCTQNPPKRTEAEREANREKREALIQKNKDLAPILPSYDYAPLPVLTRPRKAGTQDLVFKGRPRVRVRRYCHQCETLINSHGAQPRTCEECGHKRCSDCPRYPEAKEAYPFGYPNDKPGMKFKGLFACHECKTKYSPEAEEGAKCSACTHEKCARCLRIRPRKVEPELDPDIMETLRLRVAALRT
ncbi:hypothetical protein GGS21DRAFT_532306 [Xylaria nigripes]|nr:hypothetical protein GGS21DRAFT_532306 [Xylaria nigripes]